MRALRHPNIVALKEVLSSARKVYMVMELVRGGELYWALQREELAEATARRYFQQLVDAVDYCHRRGVYHRDLKPENLLLGEDGTLKITDFGLSAIKMQATGAQAILRTSCGSPHYVSPEVRWATGYSGAAVDAWSCGVILYLLLTGWLPFHHDEPAALQAQIDACVVDIPACVPAPAADLLSRLLVRDPARRLSLRGVKRHPWFTVDYTPAVETDEEAEEAEEAAAAAAAAAAAEAAAASAAAASAAAEAAAAAAAASARRPPLALAPTALPPSARRAASPVADAAALPPTPPSTTATTGGGDGGRGGRRRRPGTGLPRLLSSDGSASCVTAASSSSAVTEGGVGGGLPPIPRGRRASAAATIDGSGTRGRRGGGGGGGIGGRGDASPSRSPPLSGYKKPRRATTLYGLRRFGAAAAAGGGGGSVGGGGGVGAGGPGGRPSVFAEDGDSTASADGGGSASAGGGFAFVRRLSGRSCDPSDEEEAYGRGRRSLGVTRSFKNLTRFLRHAPAA
ncbi:hypothetical protein I4F81_000904 [Pyropia yezoensis]|uniref:Uncharacterized protein n=1 Tax=Pyropia yezoensis TaxID=2788 RepID=A0ACC3BK10_PYRYE|nr:hypothetical protein I4F81_000904 [Neopyropia yezoensis]